MVHHVWVCTQYLTYVMSALDVLAHCVALCVSPLLITPTTMTIITAAPKQLLCSSTVTATCCCERLLYVSMEYNSIHCPRWFYGQRRHYSVGEETIWLASPLRTWPSLTQGDVDNSVQKQAVFLSGRMSSAYNTAQCSPLRWVIRFTMEPVKTWLVRILCFRRKDDYSWEVLENRDVAQLNTKLREKMLHYALSIYDTLVVFPVMIPLWHLHLSITVLPFNHLSIILAMIWCVCGSTDYFSTCVLSVCFFVFTETDRGIPYSLLMHEGQLFISRPCGERKGKTEQRTESFIVCNGWKRKWKHVARNL